MAAEDWHNLRVRMALIEAVDGIRDRIVNDFALAGQTIPRPSRAYAVEAAIRTLKGIQAGEIVSLPEAKFYEFVTKASARYAAEVLSAFTGQDVAVEVTPDGITFRDANGDDFKGDFQEPKFSAPMLRAVN